jgi:hypothetical protein
MEGFDLWLMRYKHIVAPELGDGFGGVPLGDAGWKTGVTTCLSNRKTASPDASRQRKAPPFSGALRFRMSLDVLARQFFVVGHVYNLELFRVQRGVSAE